MRTDPKKARTYAQNILRLQKELNAANERAARYDDRTRFFKKQFKIYEKKFAQIAIVIDNLETELNEAEFLSGDVIEEKTN